MLPGIPTIATVSPKRSIPNSSQTRDRFSSAEKTVRLFPVVIATRLRSALEEARLPGLSFSQETQANAVFAVLPNELADRLREHTRFYDWDRAAGEVRWMTSWDTTEADVDAFVELIRSEFARPDGD